MKIIPTLIVVLVAGAVCGTPAPAQPVAIDTVIVGNPGNAGDLQSQGVFGAVDYVFAIGTYEVTTAQYAAFLNAVAATDTYSLYTVDMWSDEEGCQIERTGSPGSYTYSVAPDWADRPVNFVSWGDAARFANWLHNGQPTGAQDLTTTEDGSYFLDGMTTDGQLEDVVREPDATWVIPSEDEWYKAAYHKNDGVSGSYWNYPTGAEGGVSNELIDPDPGNNATFTVSPQIRTIGPPYYRTEVGAHESSPSPYGTFDQGGNVQEFTEAVPEPDIRRIRGGSWLWGAVLMAAGGLDDVMHSSDEFSDLGFRVGTLVGSDVTNLRGLDPGDTYFEWDPAGTSGAVYDLVRGDLSSVLGDAETVDLGHLSCIENDSLDESSQAFPDTDVPLPDTAFFYLVRFQDRSTVGPWGFGSDGQERTGGGGCPP